MDKCKGAGSTSMKAYCDAKGWHVNLYKDKKCTAAKLDKAKSKTMLWGKCTKMGSVYVMFKGAESIKIAVSAAALALVASQF